MIRVLLCDDHAAIRRGVRDILGEAVDIQVTGDAASPAELRTLLKTKPCDVLLLDLGLPGRGGLEILSDLASSESPPRVLIYSMYPEEQYAIRCLRAGAQGYVSKSADPQELIAATRAVAQGRKYVTAEVAQMLANSVSRPSGEDAHAALSERELQTLVKIASGRRLADIAKELSLSPKTVSVYRSRVLEKLNLANNSELMVYAIRNQLVDHG